MGIGDLDMCLADGQQLALSVGQLLAGLQAVGGAADVDQGQHQVLLAQRTEQPWQGRGGLGRGEGLIVFLLVGVAAHALGRALDSGGRWGGVVLP